MAATENTHEEYTNGQSYFTQIPSLVEATIARYNNGNGNINSINNGGKLDTRTHPDTGLQYPYNKVGDFLCRFPMDFQGYCNCGETTHRNTRGYNHSINKSKLSDELWAHKSHTKRNDLPRNRSDNDGKVNINISNHGRSDNNRNKNYHMNNDNHNYDPN